MDSKSGIIPIASDHGGFEMKRYIIGQLVSEGYEVKDFGTFSEESVDYPDFIHPLASEINSGIYEKGIIICGSGNGAQMVANKYPKVRAALCWSEEITKLARQHNNANILSLPGRFIEPEFAMKLVMIFLHTGFEGGRHQGRVDKINLD
ncbi:MAG: RpiB/LacA/LacB family sugar-phosphate isomerase [Bacteroidales bacterium]|nr:RpiB/LacA/LacB family sugar-phosphate isomerase [Bacteroidales bacterium]